MLSCTIFKIQKNVVGGSETMYVRVLNDINETYRGKYLLVFVLLSFILTSSVQKRNLFFYWQCRAFQVEPLHASKTSEENARETEEWFISLVTRI